MKKILIAVGIGVVGAIGAMEVKDGSGAFMPSRVIAIEHIGRVHDFVDAKTQAVFFDLDDTILMPKGDLFATTGWTIGLRRYLNRVYQGVLGVRGINSVITRYVIRALEKMVPALVQEESVGIISDLQRRGIVVAALTGRPLACASDTYRQLAQVHVDFTSPQGCCSSRIDLMDDGFELPAFCDHNVIMCNGNSKGRVLKSLFKKTGFKPTKFVVVDDDRGFLGSIEREFADSETQFVGLWYRSPLVQPINFTEDMLPVDLGSEVERARSTLPGYDASSPH